MKVRSWLAKHEDDNWVVVLLATSLLIAWAVDRNWIGVGCMVVFLLCKAVDLVAHLATPTVEG